MTMTAAVLFDLGGVLLPFNRERRVQVIVERLGVDPANAEKMMAETDQQRDQYVKSQYGRNRQDLTQYDLVLNAERLGFEGAADVIVADVKRRGWT